MNLKKRPKGQQRKLPNSKTSVESKTIKIDVTLNILNKLIAYMLFHVEVSTTFLQQIKKFFDSIDLAYVATDIDKEVRCSIVMQLLSLILEKRINDIDILIDGLLEIKPIEKVNFIIDDLEARVDEDAEFIGDETIKFVNEFISSRLKYTILFKNQDALEHNLHKLRSNDYDSLSELSNTFLTIADEISKGIRSAAAESEDTYSDFNNGILNSAEKAFSAARKKLRMPSNFIKTGIKGLNALLNNGFEVGRSYVFLGASGGGKSVVLLNCLKWFVEHNKNIGERKKGLKPTVLYITQENTNDETIERMYYMGLPTEITKEVSFEDREDGEVLDLLKNISGWDGVDVAYEIRYRKNKSITTGDVDAMIEDLAQKGFDVRLLIHDYIKRIKPVDVSGDLRIDLAEVVNDWSVIAKERQIPVVTAMQLNRDGIAKLEEARARGKVGEKVGSQFMGEAMGIAENANGVIVIAKAYDASSDTTYMTFYRTKSRGRPIDKRDFIAVPFVKGSEIRFKEDLGLTESFTVYDLGSNLPDFKPSVTSVPVRKKRSGIKPNITPDASSLTGVGSVTLEGDFL